MRILILGLKGQIAQSLIESANARGLTTRAVGRPELDIRDRPSIERAITVFDPDILVNVAAYTAVDQAEREPETAFSINRDGARHAAQTACAAGIPIIHVSTDYVFDGKSPSPYREDDVTAPLNVYGRSKLEGEYAVAEATSDYLILRTSWVYSAFGNNFLKSMLRLAKGGTVRVVDDQIGCPTYAFDIAEAILDLCASWSKVKPNGVFHLAAAGETSWFGFARHIFTLSAKHGGPTAVVQPIKTAEYPTAALRPANSRLDCTRLRDATGISLPHWHDASNRCVGRLFRKT
jgi:dTDP-4-dehydrorhamnose reductase